MYNEHTLRTGKAKGKGIQGIHTQRMASSVSHAEWSFCWIHIRCCNHLLVEVFCFFPLLSHVSLPLPRLSYHRFGGVVRNLVHYVQFPSFQLLVCLSLGNLVVFFSLSMPPLFLLHNFMMCAIFFEHIIFSNANWIRFCMLYNFSVNKLVFSLLFLPLPIADNRINLLSFFEIDEWHECTYRWPNNCFGFVFDNYFIKSFTILPVFEGENRRLFFYWFYQDL